MSEMRTMLMDLSRWRCDFASYTRYTRYQWPDEVSIFVSSTVATSKNGYTAGFWTCRYAGDRGRSCTKFSRWRCLVHDIALP